MSGSQPNSAKNELWDDPAWTQPQPIRCSDCGEVYLGPAYYTFTCDPESGEPDIEDCYDSDAHTISFDAVGVPLTDPATHNFCPYCADQLMPNAGADDLRIDDENLREYFREITGGV